MNNFFLSLSITTLSGLSTFLGFFLVFYKPKSKEKMICYSLILSSIVMSYISLFDLIPASLKYFCNYYNFLVSLIIFLIYFIFGLLLVIFLFKNNKSNDSLYKVGLVSLIGLILHNIPEGIITFLSLSKDITLGFSLAISIALHNIPEGILISIPIYYSTKSKYKTLAYILIASLIEPLGGLLYYLIFKDINIYLFAILLAFASGIMIYLSIIDLFNGLKHYKKRE